VDPCEAVCFDVHPWVSWRGVMGVCPRAVCWGILMGEKRIRGWGRWWFRARCVRVGVVGVGVWARCGVVQWLARCSSFSGWVFWLGGWLVGWFGWVVGWLVGLVGSVVGSVVGWLGQWLVQWLGGWVVGWLVGPVVGSVVGPVVGWSSGWVSGWLVQWLVGPVVSPAVIIQCLGGLPSGWVEWSTGWWLVRIGV